MQVKLKVLSGKNAGKEIAIPGERFVIGRGPDCHLRPASEAIAVRHCELTIFSDGLVTLCDFGSPSGTFVNGEKLLANQPRELKSGDKLTVGPLEFEAVLVHEIGGRKLSKVTDLKQVVARTVAKPAAESETDVSDWLTEDESRSAHARFFDVTGFKAQVEEGAEETGESAGGQEQEDAEKEAQEKAAHEKEAHEKERGKKDPKEAKDKKEEKKKFGKLPAPPPVEAAKDTREAATEMLKKFFKK